MAFLFFGNRRFHKFQEAQDMIGLGTAFAVSDGEELLRIIRQREPNAWRELGRLNSAYVQERIGASERILSWISQHLG